MGYFVVMKDIDGKRHVLTDPKTDKAFKTAREADARIKDLAEAQQKYFGARIYHRAGNSIAMYPGRKDIEFWRSSYHPYE